MCFFLLTNLATPELTSAYENYEVLVDMFADYF